MNIVERAPEPVGNSPYRGIDQSKRTELYITWVRPFRRLKRLLAGLSFCTSAVISWFMGSNALSSGPLTIIIMFSVVGIVLGISSFVRLEIELTASRLAISKYPLPHFAGRSLQLSPERIGQAWVDEVVDEEHDKSWYRLMFELNNGRSVASVCFDTKEQALWVEQRLEAALAIQDRVVLGEVSTV